MVENKVIRGARLSPVLVLKKGKEVLLIDVTLLFENGLEALNETRMKKKYKEIVQDL